MAFCPACGKPVNVGASFCGACGASLAPAPPPPSPTSTTPPTATPSTAAPWSSAPARVRPIGITIIGIVTIVFSAFWILGSLAGLAFIAAGAQIWRQFFSVWMPWIGAFGSAFVALAFIALLFVIALGILGIVTGTGILQGRPWAWGLGIVLMGLDGLSNLFGLASRNTSSIVGVLVAILVIWYFFQPDVKRWFGRA